MMVKARRCGAALLMVALVSLATGCGDDDDAVADSGAPPEALTGSPIELGLANTENSPAGNYVDSRKGFEAAVEYVNRELGGVNGRPLRLESCVTNGSPETSIACANQFVQKNKLAVMPGLDLGAAGAIPVYANAGMPYIGGLQTSAPEYTYANSFSFIGAAPSLVSGDAAYVAQTLKAKKVSVLGASVPAFTTAVDNFMKPVLSKLGVDDVTVITEDPNTADMTPAVTRANAGDPDALIILFGGSSCSKLMQAVAQVNVPAEKVLYGPECANPAAVEAGGRGAEGASFGTNFVSPHSDEANAQTFRQKLEQYSDAEPSVSTQNGFDTVMNLYGVLKKIDPNDISRQSLIDALKGAKNEPGFMSHGFTCDGQQFPKLTGLCDTHVRAIKYVAGKFVETSGEWLNGASFLVPGARPTPSSNP